MVAAAPRAPLAAPLAVMPAPEATPDEDLPGLDPDVVVRVVGEHQGAITGCHVIGYSGRPSHAGSVTLAWSIAPAGNVRNVHVSESSFDDTSFHDCLVAVVAGLEFPEAPGSTEIGSWRFRFRSSGGEAAAAN